MPYLDAIRVFVRVVELGSITAAGRDQRLTPAVASNRIKDLERRLGVRLFNRTTRKLALTEVGRVYYEHAQKVLEALDESEAAVARFSSRPRGALRVLAPLGLGRRVIAPLIPAFNARYPEIEIRLRLTDRKADFLQEGVDVAFVLGTLQDSAMKLRTIHECARVLCAAPDYLARRGVPQRPEELISNGHNCLLLRFPGSTDYCWTLRQGPGPEDGWKRYHVAGAFDADDGDVLTAWALDGAGIVNKPRFEVAEHVAAGRLVPILTDCPPRPGRFACLYPHKRFQDPKARAFIDFMADACRTRVQQMEAAWPADVPDTAPSPTTAAADAPNTSRSPTSGVE